VVTPKSSLVVFLRGVNVGGNKTLRPAELARAIGAVNLGAAGTFVLHAGGSAGAIRKAIVAELEFDAEVIVCTGSEVLDLVRRAGKTPPPYGKELKAMVTVLAKPPATAPRLPVSTPAGADWQVRVERVDGPFVTSLWRRGEGRLIYPNEVVEKLFGIPGTTRGWSTIESIRKILEAGPPARKKGVEGVKK